MNWAILLAEILARVVLTLLAQYRKPQNAHREGDNADGYSRKWPRFSQAQCRRGVVNRARAGRAESDSEHVSYFSD